MLTTLAQNLKRLRPERERSRENKSKNRRLNASSYEPDIYGIQQIDSVDEETLLLFSSKTDKACLRDLFDSHCFMGEAEKQVHDFCFI